MKNDNFFPFFTFSATLPTFKIYGNSYTFCHTSLRKDTITLAFSKISYFCKKQNVSRKVGTKHILESQKWPWTPPYPLMLTIWRKSSGCNFLLKMVQLTLSISISQGTREFVQDRESSRLREKIRLQPTERDRDLSST